MGGPCQRPGGPDPCGSSQGIESIMRLAAAASDINVVPEECSTLLNTFARCADSMNRASSIGQSGAHSLLAALLQNSTELNTSFNLDASLPITSGRTPSAPVHSIQANGLRAGNGGGGGNGSTGPAERSVSLSLFASGPMRVRHSLLSAIVCMSLFLMHC
jgi:hypothetical protein